LSVRIAVTAGAPRPAGRNICLFSHDAWIASTLRGDLAMLEKSRAEQEEIRCLNKMPDGHRLKKSPPPATVRAAGGGENENKRKRRRGLRRLN